MIQCINIVKKSGIKPVISINVFHTDTAEEIKMIKRAAEKEGARVAEGHY